MCFLTAPQSSLQPAGLIPTAGLEARDVQLAGGLEKTNAQTTTLHPRVF